MKVLNTIMNPNLSIIVPGRCNEHCNFCFWKRDPDEVKDVDVYTAALDKTLSSLTEQFTQISITGGEPTISPYFKPILDILSSHRDQFKKVVLTTNGSVPKKCNPADYLENLVLDIDGVVDYVNISVHHYDAAYNNFIFKGERGTARPSIQHSTTNLALFNKLLNKSGVPSNANCVLTDTLLFTETLLNADIKCRGPKGNILKYISNMKDYGFSSITFRKPHTCNSGLEPSLVEGEFSDYKVIGESRCPVCVAKTQIIEGMYITWKRSIVEPSEELENLIYELIIHPDGKVYADWSKNIEVII